MLKKWPTSWVSPTETALAPTRGDMRICLGRLLIWVVGGHDFGSDPKSGNGTDDLIPRGCLPHVGRCRPRRNLTPRECDVKKHKSDELPRAAAPFRELSLRQCRAAHGLLSRHAPSTSFKKYAEQLMGRAERGSSGVKRCDV